MTFAASGRAPHVVKWLLMRPAGIGVRMVAQRDDDGLMPMHCAIASGDRATVQMLLDRLDAAALYGSDLEGEGGWVDDLLRSEHARVRKIALERVASRKGGRAVQAAHRLIREGGTLAAVAALEEQLERAFEENSLFPESRTPHYWEETIALATEHGRVDVVRWLYSPRRSFFDFYGLDCMVRCIDWEVDEGQRDHAGCAHRISMGRPELSGPISN